MRNIRRFCLYEFRFVFSSLKNEESFSLFANLDLKVHLQSTDYGNFLANEPSPLSVNIIDERLREKLVQEFQHLRNVSYQPLSRFLDYITFVEGFHS